MSSPTPLATPTELALLLGLSNDEVDDVRAAFLISLATQRCAAFVSPSPLPAGAQSVVLAVAAKAYLNPSGRSGVETVGPTAAPLPPGGIFLSRDDKTTLRRLTGSGGAFSIDTLPPDLVSPGWPEDWVDPVLLRPGDV